MSKILIVDDEPFNIDYLEQELEELDYSIITARDGRKALDQVRSEQPDLILLDIMMPGLDGFETCRRLKQNKSTEAIPIIFMTALTETVDEVKGLELGAVDYITKPIKVETVLARVRTHLTLRKLRGDLERKNSELEEALAKVKILRGLLPICANCKKIRDDRGYWQEVEEYIKRHTEAEFSHGFCPECMKLMFGDLSASEGSLPNA